MKFFATAGPVEPQDNYFVPVAGRLDERELDTLIKQKKYFILHAPRQTGKTSTMMNFAKILNAGGIYTALYVNVEAGQAARNDYVKAMATILEQFFRSVKGQLPQERHILSYLEQVLHRGNFTGSSLNSMLNEWALHSPKPLVLLIDEIDALVGDTLISVLRQLRSGYAQRPQGFPQSLCLIGVRDVRDYRIWSDEKQAVVLGGSAFNIKAKSLRMADFTAVEVRYLYLQHTAETGQPFDEAAIAHAFELTQGQPWLVNALAQEVCFELQTNRAQPITRELIERAKEIIIQRRDTHLDVLIDRLQEPRIRNIVDAIITGNIKTAEELKPDDIQYARDLGLIKLKGLEIANPIYQEVIPRELTYARQEQMIQDIRWYQNPDGSLNMTLLLEAFVEFYRENSADWLADCRYKESGPHLLMMAFLQRVINGGGRIHREYALGRRRLDLLLTWQKQKIVIELKVYKDAKTLLDGLVQMADYMDTSGAREGHLIIFDKRPKSWEEKIYTKKETIGNRAITVWGL
ncbi:MAG: AAA-like domain-containing protein [Candidatus Dependentiae bacterium]|nr:AAA-like domain-containing protein [Candidatus Dependentiae bacterium]